MIAGLEGDAVDPRQRSPRRAGGRAVVGVVAGDRVHIEGRARAGCGRGCPAARCGRWAAARGRRRRRFGCITRGRLRGRDGQRGQYQNPHPGHDHFAPTPGVK